MRNKFDEQLEQLSVEMVKMGALCEESILYATTGLFEKDTNSSKKAIQADEDIDSQERTIETLCMKLLLQQQPVAKDLRIISSALKMVSDMERIGDQAADIAEISLMIGSDPILLETHLKDMTAATIKMVTDSISSFVARDIILARNVIEYDDIVDELFNNVKNELINIISKTPEKGESCIDILMVAKYLERIGDHATNIAEWVEYSITGIHKGEPL